VLEKRLAGRRRIDVVSSIPRPGADAEIRIGKWQEGENDVSFRYSTIPAGMTIAEAERIVTQPGWKPILQTEGSEHVEIPKNWLKRLRSSQRAIACNGRRQAWHLRHLW
jgi:hypothetical protein